RCWRNPSNTQPGFLSCVSCLIGVSSLDRVPPVAYASSFAVGIPSRPPNACDGIGRRKDEQGRPLPIYKPEARSKPAAQRLRRRNNRVNQCLYSEAVQKSLAGYAIGPDAPIGGRRRKSPQGAAFISSSTDVSWSSRPAFSILKWVLT